MYESVFPGLKNGYKITSDQDSTYNCIGWAAGLYEWLEPDPYFFFKWPNGIPRQYTLHAYINLYEQFGFKVCDDDSQEEGLEKVAIFVDSKDEPTHAARQLISGKWTSKLGQGNDISHNLRDLEGNQYGTVAAIMARKRVEEDQNTSVKNEK